MREDRPGPAAWVVPRRHAGDPGETKVYLCKAPAGTPEETLVRLSGRRWPVESAILEAKGELGLDHDEGRSWTGWHHRTAMTSLAPHCLVRRRCRLGGNAPALTVPQVRPLLQATLPRRRRDATTVLAPLGYIQRQNPAAYRSHRRRRLRHLAPS